MCYGQFIVDGLMETKEMKVTRNPQKNYGETSWTDISPTLLATDYKSPPWVLEYYEDGQNNH